MSKSFLHNVCCLFWMHMPTKQKNKWILTLGASLFEAEEHCEDTEPVPWPVLSENAILTLFAALKVAWCDALSEDTQLYELAKRFHVLQELRTESREISVPLVLALCVWKEIPCSIYDSQTFLVKTNVPLVCSSWYSPSSHIAECDLFVFFICERWVETYRTRKVNWFHPHSYIKMTSHWDAYHPLPPLSQCSLQVLNDWKLFVCARYVLDSDFPMAASKSDQYQWILRQFAMQKHK